MLVFSDCLIICFLLNLILGASSSEFHSISSTSESPHKQEELEKWKQKTKIVETEKLKGENKIIIKFGYNVHCHWLKKRLQSYRGPSWLARRLLVKQASEITSTAL